MVTNHNINSFMVYNRINFNSYPVFITKCKKIEVSLSLIYCVNFTDL